MAKSTHDRLIDALGLPLVLGMDGRNISGGLSVRRCSPRLLSMADEILEVLYRAHDERIRSLLQCYVSVLGGLDAGRRYACADKV